MNPEPPLITALVVVQLVYLGGLVTVLWFYSLPINRVDLSRAPEGPLPRVVLFYPVLRELEETMRTTFTGMRRADYPEGYVRVISIPNADDTETIASLRRLQDEFPFLEVMPVPATTDSSWERVWTAWDSAPGAYWWHEGKRAKVRALPPKKTRQLVWAMYQVADQERNSLLSYIDADSVIPEDYFHGAAAGMERFDVVQNTNITGNPLASLATSFYAQDHISWDATLYRHMTADGTQPFYVLGKGLFFRFSDLVRVGGFHPWLTIEDPEIGMRLWTTGARLGVVESPLIEEVPMTWSQGVTQRKRWVAGFFQSLGSPLRAMGMTPYQRFRARLNFVPCLSLAFNPIGFGIGIWAIVAVSSTEGHALNVESNVLSILTLSVSVILMSVQTVRGWQMTAPVLTRRQRVLFLLRVNPVTLLLYYLWWTVPLVKGWLMFLRDGGLVWERTEKRDANNVLVRSARTVEGSRRSDLVDTEAA